MNLLRLAAQAWKSNLGFAKRRVIAARLGMFARRRSAISIEHDESLGIHQFVFQKNEHHRLAVFANRQLIETNRNAFSTLWRRGGVIANILSQPAIPSGEYPCSLHDMCFGRTIGFCSNDPDAVLVPDRGFHFSDGYRDYRKLGEKATAWESRSPQIVWRGSITGHGLPLTETMHAADPQLAQRVRLCVAARAIPQTDLKLIVGKDFSADVWQTYDRMSIRGGYVDQNSWAGNKFAIDIDGHANAFSNFYIRMLLGCCVLKVASPQGYQQWYYNDLQPWVHYVPVGADLTDLAEAIAWCRSHDDACREIAHNARQFAAARTTATELQSCAASIASRFSCDTSQIAPALVAFPLKGHAPASNIAPAAASSHTVARKSA